MTTFQRAVLALLLPAALSGCRPDAKQTGLVATAEFGVFFGGQIQERSSIPFQLSKQKHGFRLVFNRPLPRDVPVNWELDIPGSAAGVRDKRGTVGRGRITKLGEGLAKAQTTQFDHTMSFEPGAPLGAWNIRVLVHPNELVIDRTFEVYDARARQAAIKKLQDGG